MNLCGIYSILNGTDGNRYQSSWGLCNNASPEFITPTDWLSPLLGRVDITANGGGLQSVLDILMLRFSDLQEVLYEVNLADLLCTGKSAQLTKWLSGSTYATALPHAWPKRCLTRDD